MTRGTLRAWHGSSKSERRAQGRDAHGVTVDPFEAGDAAAVAALFERIYPADRRATTAELAAYFRKVFLENPWPNADIPSWIARRDGQVIGFLGVIQRPMRLGSRPLRAAIPCQFLVHPEMRHSTAAVRLMRVFVRGPQDLSIADGANERTGKLWQWVRGGCTSPMYNLSWIRVFRPFRSALRFTQARRRWLAPLAAAGLPLGALADACVRRAAPFRCATPLLEEEALSSATLLEALSEHATGFPLRPHYDRAGLEWLLAQVESKARHGTLQARLVRDRDGSLCGWFLYYLHPAMSRVVQLAARPDRMGAVLDHLFHHADERGTLALEGRMEPRFAAHLGARHCLFYASSELTMFHAREAPILAPLLRGDAFFTRMEGEWWLRFHGESPPRAAPRSAEFASLGTLGPEAMTPPRPT